MNILKNFIEKFRARKQQEKELEEGIRIQRRVAEKQKNANERELERYMEERRQKMIEDKLRSLRKGKTAEMWRSNAFTNNKFLFKDKCYLGRYY